MLRLPAEALHTNTLTYTGIVDEVLAFIRGWSETISGGMGVQDWSHQQLVARIAKAASNRDLAEVVRDQFDADGVRSCGCVLAASEDLLLLHRLSDRIDFDGYEVLKVKDVTHFNTDFDRKQFYEKALHAKSIVPSDAPDVSLSSMRHLLESVDAKFPLIVIEREVRTPDECEIGRIRLLTDMRYALKWLSPDARWEDDGQTYAIEDITRVTFDGEYENTLALVAGIIGQD